MSPSYPPAPYSPLPGTPRAIICDIDGTVALRGNRSPYDWTRVADDTPNRPVIEVVQALHASGHQVIFMSGRSAICELATGMWIETHVAANWSFDNGFLLLMRRQGDNRQDAVIKAELFDQHVRTRFNVRAVFDDRLQVIRMWREMGLTVLDVAGGDF